MDVVGKTQDCKYQGNQSNDKRKESAGHSQYPKPEVFFSLSCISRKNRNPADRDKKPKAN